MTLPGIWSQRDARWGGIMLGFNTSAPYNIYHYGCAITAAANLIWWATGDASWTPARVNQWMKDNAGFVPGGGLIIWSKLAQLMSSFGMQYHGFTTDLNVTNNFLNPENNFAIAQLSGPGFPMHFSAMPYVGKIGDSWDAALKPVTHYHFVGAHLFTHVPPALTPPPAHVPQLTPAPVQAPIPAAPMPPAPSNEKPVTQPEPEIDAILATLQPATSSPIQQPVPTPAPERTWPVAALERPGWVEVGTHYGAPIRDVVTDEELQIIPQGTKFLATHFAVRNDNGRAIYYLISENMIEGTQTRGVHPDDVHRTDAPQVDSIAKAGSDATGTPSVGASTIALNDLGPTSRKIARVLHALFGDWHIIKKDK